MRLLLYGDLHAANLYSFNVKRSKYQFSQYSRVDELYSTLAWIAQMTKQNEIMMTVNMGDTFHQALRFYVERYNTVIKAVNTINQLSLLKSGVVIEGNHDRSDEISAVDTLENVQGTVLVKNSIKVKYVSEINSHLIFVPYIRNPDKTKEAFNALYEKYKGSKSNLYVFCHLEIREAYGGLIPSTSTYQLNQMNTYDDLKLGIYKKIFSGHIHFKRIVNNNFCYIGSSLNHNFSDRLARKGITIVDIDSDDCKIQFKENPYCPFFVRFNMENMDSSLKNIRLLEKELKNFPQTNVYARIHTISNEKGREKSADFIRDYGHLFSAYEIKNLDSEEDLRASDMIVGTTGHVNVFDLIIEHGRKMLTSQEKSEKEIEEYINRLKRICL